MSKDHEPAGCTPVELISLLSLRDYDVVVRCLEWVRISLATIAPYAAEWRCEVIPLCHHHPNNRYPALGVVDGDERAIDQLSADIDRWIEGKSVQWVVTASVGTMAKRWSEL